MQNTLSTAITIQGIGLHSGKMVTMKLHPAPADHGIVFVRTDLKQFNRAIPARWDHVVDTRLCTMIGNQDGASVGTIEHLMAALRGCGVDNLLIEIDGPEVPVMDGSSAPFVKALDEVGTISQGAPRRAIRVLKEVMVEEDGKRVRLSPADESVFVGQIDFNHPMIGAQFYETKMVNGNFRHDLSEARTFCFQQEVDAMRSMGRALGGSLDNAIVLDQTGVLNEAGLRFDDEFIRHKLLDAVGDLFLAGGPVIGAYEGYKAGHALNNQILRKLFATPGAYEFVDVMQDDVAIVPSKDFAARKLEGALATA